MTPIERRIKKLEAERAIATRPQRPPDIRYWHSPEGMTGLAEQETWFEQQKAAAAPPVGPTINVHFIRHVRPG